VATKLVTADRAARLNRLLQFLRSAPQSRESLLRHLGLNVRGFYRDLETLHKLGIPIALSQQGYWLAVALQEALNRLPFPDPGLTFSEAVQLSKGRTGAHRKLKRVIARLSR
jgi:predicted DNA-binding transcriptional regulator YafY